MKESRSPSDMVSTAERTCSGEIWTSMGVKVMGGRSDRGFLGGFDRTPNAGKFPWVDRGWAIGQVAAIGLGFDNELEWGRRQAVRDEP